MKDLLTDANFPRTSDGRTYHLSTRAGEIANRIITVGSPGRAEAIATLFDAAPSTFRLSSERAFLTLTGRVRGVPITVVSIGMGYPNIDFFVREARECVNGDMVIVRLGSCGCLLDVNVGTLVVPKSSVAVTRNYDFDFVNPSSTPDIRPYLISREMDADTDLTSAVESSLQSTRPDNHTLNVLRGKVNASADSFYSTQGRQTSFPDRNAGLIDTLLDRVPNMATLEMETAHLFHLAQSWPRNVSTFSPSGSAAPIAPPIADPPGHPNITSPPGPSSPPSTSLDAAGGATSGRRGSQIRAAAVHMVFAARQSNAFITPEQVAVAEEWAGRGVVEALVGFKIASESLHEEKGSVWELKA